MRVDRYHDYYRTIRYWLYVQYLTQTNDLDPLDKLRSVGLENIYHQHGVIWYNINNSSLDLLGDSVLDIPESLFSFIMLHTSNHPK